MNTDDDDTLALLYSEAYRLTAAGTYDRKVGTTRTGRDPARDLARLRAKVDADFGKTDAARMAKEAIADGVADATDGREPRW